MDDNKLPEPTEGAAARNEFSQRAIAALLPGIGEVIAYGLGQLIQKRLKVGTDILIEEIERSGRARLDQLTEGQKEYFLPQAYRFMEQVRVGEYRHNLRVLAKILAGTIGDEGERADTGIMLRSARALEGLPLDGLVALARCDEAFEKHRAPEFEFENGSRFVTISEQSLMSAYGSCGEHLGFPEAAQHLTELAARGFLFLEPGSRFEGSAFGKTQLFSEVISAGRATVEHHRKQDGEAAGQRK
jgi:hypothetical protein